MQKSHGNPRAEKHDDENEAPSRTSEPGGQSRREDRHAGRQVREQELGAKPATTGGEHSRQGSALRATGQGLGHVNEGREGGGADASEEISRTSEGHELQMKRFLQVSSSMNAENCTAAQRSTTQEERRLCTCGLHWGAGQAPPTEEQHREGRLCCRNAGSQVTTERHQQSAEVRRVTA